MAGQFLLCLLEGAIGQLASVKFPNSVYMQACGAQGEALQGLPLDLTREVNRLEWSQKLYGLQFVLYRHMEIPEKRRPILKYMPHCKNFKNKYFKLHMIIFFLAISWI